MTTAALATALEDIVHSCKRAIEADIKVCLVVPGPPPRTETVRLVPGRKRCPRGEIANWKDDPPRTVAYFDPIEILAYFVAQGLIKVQET